MSLVEQFRSFYYRNYPNDMEEAIELFSIFGGLDVAIDCSKDTTLLIREIILNNFFKYQSFFSTFIGDDPAIYRLLHALSVGDRRIFSAFKRARLNNFKGGNALGILQKLGIVLIEYSREEDKRKYKPKLSKEEAKHRISDKFFIRYPFVRFWFYFIYPHQKEIAKGKYASFFTHFTKEKNRYTSLVFEELSNVLLDYYLQDEEIATYGSYWDANVEIDGYIVTKKGNIYVAECKWSNRQINKKELNKLLEKCNILAIKPQKVILFSKRGFSKELQTSQIKSLQLFSVKDFDLLVKSPPKQNYFPLEIDV